MRHSAPARYGIAIACVALSVLMRWALDPYLSWKFAFIQQYPAILVAAWFGGLGPGLLATALSAVAVDLMVLSPEATFGFHDFADVVGLWLFVATGAFIAVLNESLRRDRRRAEDAEQRYRSVVEQAFDAVVLVDGNLTVVDINPQVTVLLGYTREELLGTRALDLIDPADLEAMPPQLEPIRRGQTVEWRHRLMARDGQRPLVAGRSKQIAPGLIVSTFRDVTKEQAAIEERERLLREAQTANRMKDDFLATLSHELRTPLNAVLGWTQMLAHGELPASRVAHALAVIERNAEAQRRLVDELLDMSRIVNGRMRLNVHDVDVAHLIQDAIDIVRPAAAGKQLTIDTRFSLELRPIPADAERLRQAVWNLLTNAIKFTPPGGRITVTAYATAEGISIEVGDTGQGIVPEFLPHLFEPFQQADITTTRTTGGLGLGLAIVRYVVEAHGGQISAHSDGPGRGSTFTLRLPAQASQQSASA
jgi:PAS domain S-box-containing protein